MKNLFRAYKVRNTVTAGFEIGADISPVRNRSDYSAGFDLKETSPRVKFQVFEIWGLSASVQPLLSSNDINAILMGLRHIVRFTIVD